ncbi:helix-turn-helix domain-containing protein [Nocardioides flavescens]|uniref:Helix-turn-helix domain-containing protein n=1 Tax=Nocardioides flavescens TaxID=2691959 RepID=A0A6L7EX26_9ACTN|nr:helix-turn-helix domain-containing protein [Nocardioides flavescens]MXG88805.1 helix-turn-helix domain-containing protein [Nocardioides flavescens]
MANRPAPAVVLGRRERRGLDRLDRGDDTALALRARIVLLAATGASRSGIADDLGVSRATVHTWCTRWTESGLSGLDARPRTGRPTTVEAHDVVRATLRRPLGRGAAPHWTARSLAEHLGIGRSSVSRAWQRYGVRPDQGGGFRFDTDPGLLARGGRLVAVHADRRHRLAVVAVDGPVADRLAGHGVVTTVHAAPLGGSGAHGPRTTVLTTVQTPGGSDLATALARLAARPETPADTLAAAQRGRSGLLSDARLHLVAQDPRSLAAPEVADWLAAHEVPGHAVTDPAVWPGLVAACLLLGERRPGAATTALGSPVEPRLTAALREEVPAGATLSWVTSLRESGRPVVPLRRTAERDAG